MGPEVATTHPYISHVVPLSPGQAVWGGAGRKAWIKISLDHTSLFLCWDRR